MENDHVALAQFDALAFGRAANLLFVVRRAFGYHADAEIAGHIQNDTARDDSGQVFQAQFRQARGRGERVELKAPVVDVIDARMAEPVDLRTDSQPSGEEIVIVGERIFAEAGIVGLAWLCDMQSQETVAKCRGRVVHHDSQAVHLAFRDKARRLKNRLRGHPVCRTELVVGSPGRFMPIFGHDRRGRHKRRKTRGGKNGYLLHSLLPDARSLRVGTNVPGGDRNREYRCAVLRRANREPLPAP